MASFKPKEIVKILKKLGFSAKRQTGSHLIMYRISDNKIIPVPIHSKDVKKGLLKGIIKQANSSEEQFIKLK
jgi:predicted RNA binding protein YcfA (HicA-like mRNA interferase family)